MSPKIRKYLFANFVLEKQGKKSIESAVPKSKEKQILAKAVGTDMLRKYRVQHKFAKFLPYRMNRKKGDSEKGRLDYERKEYNSVKMKATHIVRKFFDDDTVFKMLPGKKDFVRKQEECCLTLFKIYIRGAYKKLVFIDCRIPRLLG